MGLDVNAVQFLMAARRDGVALGDVLMLGRQDLNVYPAKMRQVLKGHGFSDKLFATGAPDTGFAEPCFKALGARRVWSMDVSAFEGADFVHDLNEPIDAPLEQRFDVVYDGGTLEHVFDVRTALSNCIRMTKVGGRLFIHTGTNNWCGHGFYQFSPELFWRVFSPENGCQVERMILHAVGPYGRWYEVSDPKAIQSRVELITCVPVQLLIRAQRTSAAPVFAQAVQQSDFQPRWGECSEEPDASGRSTSKGAMGTRSALSASCPGLARLVNVIRVGFGWLRTHSVRNGRSFRRLSKGM